MTQVLSRSEIRGLQLPEIVGLSQIPYGLLPNRYRLNTKLRLVGGEGMESQALSVRSLPPETEIEPKLPSSRHAITPPEPAPLKSPAAKPSR